MDLGNPGERLVTPSSAVIVIGSGVSINEARGLVIIGNRIPSLLGRWPREVSHKFSKHSVSFFLVMGEVELEPVNVLGEER
jgi:hypothetical protein